MALQILIYWIINNSDVIEVTERDHYYKFAWLSYPHNILQDIEALKKAISFDINGNFMIDFG